MFLFDSHIHLDDAYFNLLPPYLEAARAQNIRKWLIPATIPASFPRIKEICMKETGCYPAYGLHPYFINDYTCSDLNQLEAWLVQACAIGECGLDLMMQQPDLERQLQFFTRQLDYAKNMHLPVIIHARKSLDLVLKTLRRYPTVTGVVHSFSGSEQQAQQLIDLGFYLGFGGAVTYPRALKLQRILKKLPDEFLLIETDAPFQPGHTIEKGRLHQPADLLPIAKEVARIRQKSIESLIQTTTLNTYQLLNLQGDFT